jgi:hypothetical protein
MDMRGEHKATYLERIAHFSGPLVESINSTMVINLQTLYQYQAKTCLALTDAAAPCLPDTLIESHALHFCRLGARRAAFLDITGDAFHRMKGK